jgi:ribosomal protein S18 acetylase RimI-like enzyme
VRLGDTVSLRVQTDAGVTEVVGTVLAASADSLTVRRRDGTVLDLAVTQITASRVVPPSPAQTISAAELEQIAAQGWRAIEEQRLGDWLLRASGGVTGRANSVLAAGDPGRPLDDAIATVASWYDARDLPAQIQLADGLAPAALGSRLDELGWTTSPLTHVMTAELAPVLRGAHETGVDVRLDESLDEVWLAGWRVEGPGFELEAAHTLLTNHQQAVFASVREGERCLAIARAAVDGRWAGLFCVEVAGDGRREGLGRAISVAALRWAVAHGARRSYLQTSSDNTAAIALYESMGFTHHHNYVYRSRPRT